MTVALSLQDVRVRYGDTLAVDGVSLDVQRGEVVGLLGPNGSGKSTLLAVAAGVIDPVEGFIAVDGMPRLLDPARFAARVGLVPQVCALYDEFTPTENLTFFGGLYGLAGRDLRRRIARVLSRLGLADHAAQRVGTLSGGMRQRVNLAVALLHDPPVLLLDEPTAALDPASRDTFFVELTRLRDDGHAILFSTHHLDEAEIGCDRIGVLDRGKLVALGPPGELLSASPVGTAVIFGHLRTKLPRFLERSLRKRLGRAVELEIIGRRMRLAAIDTEELGRALAMILAEGVELESFRSPAGTLERAMRSDVVVATEK